MGNGGFSQFQNFAVFQSVSNCMLGGVYLRATYFTVACIIFHLYSLHCQKLFVSLFPSSIGNHLCWSLLDSCLRLPLVLSLVVPRLDSRAGGGSRYLVSARWPAGALAWNTIVTTQDFHNLDEHHHQMMIRTKVWLCAVSVFYCQCEGIVDKIVGVSW